MKNQNKGIGIIAILIAVSLIFALSSYGDYIESFTYYPVTGNLSSDGSQSNDSVLATVDSNVVYYPFDADSISDYSGNHSATVIASSGGHGLLHRTSTDSFYGGTGAIKMNFNAGVDSALYEIPDVAHHLDATVEASIGMWINASAPTDSVCLIGFGDTNADEEIAFFLTRLGDIKGRCIDGGSVAWYCSTNTQPITAGTWSHVMFIQDGDSVTIYTNNTIENIVRIAGSAGGSWFEECSGIDNGRLGSHNYNSLTNIGFYTGFIDELIIDKDAWTSTQRSDVYDYSTYNTAHSSYRGVYTDYTYNNVDFGYDAARQTKKVLQIYVFAVIEARASDTTGTLPALRSYIEAKDTTDGNTWSLCSDTVLHSYAGTSYISSCTLSGYIDTSIVNCLPCQFRIRHLSDTADVGLFRLKSSTYIEPTFFTTEP